MKNTNKMMPFPNRIISPQSETTNQHQHWNKMPQNRPPITAPNPNNNVNSELNNAVPNMPPNNDPAAHVQALINMNLEPAVIQQFFKQMGMQVNSIPNLNNRANINMGNNTMGHTNVPNFQAMNQVPANPFNNSGDTSKNYLHNNVAKRIQTEVPSNANSVKTVHKQDNKIIGKALDTQLLLYAL